MEGDPPALQVLRQRPAYWMESRLVLIFIIVIFWHASEKGGGGKRRTARRSGGASSMPQKRRAFIIAVLKFAKKYGDIRQVGDLALSCPVGLKCFLPKTLKAHLHSICFATVFFCFER